MKFKLDSLFRLYIFLCVALLGWAFLAEAQVDGGKSEIRLVEPHNGAVFTRGTNLVLSAELNVNEDSVQKVEFFRNGKSLGIITNVPFDLVWTNVPSGNFSLIAVATDLTTNSFSSPPIKIRIHSVASYLTFGLDRVDVLNYDRVGGIPLWQYIASFIYIFLAFYVSKFLDFLTRVWLRKWAEKTETKFDDLLLALINGPVKIIAFVIFLHIGLNVFSWPDWVENFLSKCLRIVVAITITYTLLKAVNMLMEYWKARSSVNADKAFDAQLFPIVSKSLKVFIVIVAILVTWQSLTEKPITAILASLSIGGLAIGLAAQDTIANFFGAVVVFVDKPFRVGDRIKLPEVDGVVETIGLRSTRVRSLDGFLITVPNKTMGNATITNISSRPSIKSETNIGITYDTPTEKVSRALMILDEVFRKHPMTQDVIISFNRFGDSALNILVVHWWKSTDGRAQLVGMAELNLEVKKRFDEEGINFAFPTQTLYIKQDSDWKLASDEKQKLLGSSNN